MADRLSYRDRVAAYFKAYPNTWICAEQLQTIGGNCAWRTRVAECRLDLGMVIENEQRRLREHTNDCPARLAWDIEGACQCGRPVRFVKSLYRYVPAPVAPTPDAGHDVNTWSLR